MMNPAYVENQVFYIPNKKLDNIKKSENSKSKKRLTFLIENLNLTKNQTFSIPEKTK